MSQSGKKAISQAGRFSKHQRWTEKEAKEVIDSWRRSGKTMVAFALREGISVHRLYRWRKRLEDWQPCGIEKRETASPQKDEKSSTSTMRFVAAELKVAEERSNEPAVVIHLEDGACIEVNNPAQTDPLWLLQIVRGL